MESNSIAVSRPNTAKDGSRCGPEISGSRFSCGSASARNPGFLRWISFRLRQRFPRLKGKILIVELPRPPVFDERVWQPQSHSRASNMYFQVFIVPVGGRTLLWNDSTSGGMNVGDFAK